MRSQNDKSAVTVRRSLAADRDARPTWMQATGSGSAVVELGLRNAPIMQVLDMRVPRRRRGRRGPLPAGHFRFMYIEGDGGALGLLTAFAKAFLRWL